jgi:hypothetical protein
MADLFDKKICEWIWPQDHMEISTAEQYNLPLSISFSRRGLDIKLGRPTSTPIPISDIETNLQRKGPTTGCKSLQEIIDDLCKDGNLPPEVCEALTEMEPPSPVPTTTPAPAPGVSPPVPEPPGAPLPSPLSGGGRPDLFRDGNAGGPRIDHVRVPPHPSPDITPDEHGDVNPRSGGPSSFDHITKKGKWWKFLAAKSPPDGIFVREDSNRAGHWFWEPARKMKLDEYINRLRKSIPDWEKTF